MSVILISVTDNHRFMCAMLRWIDLNGELLHCKKKQWTYSLKKERIEIIKLLSAKYFYVNFLSILGFIAKKIRKKGEKERTITFCIYLFICYWWTIHWDTVGSSVSAQI